MSFRTEATSIRFGLVSCRVCALSITTARRKSSSSAAMTLRSVSMAGRWIRGIQCTGGKMGLFLPAQKTLLELPQEAVPVGYVLILQLFELRQECSRLEGVVTVSFQFRKPFALLPYVFCTHRNMRFCLLQMPLQHLSANRMTRASNCIFLLFLEPMASIGDNLTRARKQLHVNVQQFIRSS